MSQRDTAKLSAEQLKAFDIDYRLEADVIRCTKCDRACHVCYAGDEFRHASSCELHGGTTRPWQLLRAILSQAVR
jgi:hypothetical protein